MVNNLYIYLFKVDFWEQTTDRQREDLIPNFEINGAYYYYNALFLLFIIN